MRIAFVSDSVYPWNFGGLETLERAEADGLAKEHELHFFSMRWPGMESEFRKNGITYHTFHDIDVSRFYRHGRRSIREAVAFSAGLLKIFRYRFDVIQSNEFPIIHIPILKAYCAITGCRLIIDVHEVWDLPYWTTYLGKVKGYLADVYANWALRMADHYIANSTITEQRLKALGIPERRISVFAPVIDDRAIARIKPTRQRREIIFVGRMIKEKRIDKWLDVLKRTAKMTKVRGLLIGDGPDRKRIEARIRRMGLGRRVEVLGFQKDNRTVFKRIKEAGLLLHMSEREGLSLIALESIALGTPVLLPSYTPIPKDVKDMCIVVDEERLPEVAKSILDGPKDDYIMNRELIERFYISKVGWFYRDLFGKLGLRGRRSR
jgi:glycosyltransferase involved in cell wall biosynthesis